MMNAIQITNIGPVEHGTIPFVSGGGLVVLKGRQGVGKSITAAAIETAVTGRGRIPVRDGSEKGCIEAFGVKITIGARQSRTGEPEVLSLESKLSIADLVDPGIIDPAAADAKRIKALVSLSGVLPSPDLFYDLLGGREAFEAVVRADTLESADLVQMASRVKSDLESAARKEESQAEHAEGRARGAKQAAGEVDTSAEADSTKLQAELEAAIREQASIAAKVESAAKARRAAQAAKDSLEDSEASYSGPTIEAGKAAVAKCEAVKNRANDEVTEAEEVVRAAQAALDKARYAQSTANNALAAAIREVKQAEQHEATVAKWREQIAASVPEAPTPEIVAAAGERVTKARAAHEQGVLIRQARQHLAECDRAIAEAAGHRKKASLLREAAKGTDEVLSGVVAKSCTTLFVEAGRLKTNTARGKTLFAELSDGERWKMSLDLAIGLVGKGGFIAIPQWAWGELQPSNRIAIARQMREAGVHGYAIEATDDEELTASVFEANGANH